MAASTNFDPIFSTTISTPAPNFTWTGIPSTYTDLVIHIQARTSINGVNTDLYMQFNNDGGNNYSRTWVSSTNATGNNHPFPGALISYCPGSTAASSLFSDDQVFIQNYYNTTTHKPYWCSFGVGSSVAWTIGQWFNPTPQAISSIKFITNDGSNFVAGSIFSLYGIVAA